MNRVYNTGETEQQLKNQYNPEGSLLRDVQMRLLDMLIYIDEVCKKINVPYRIDGGNVLGALRHGGFIPWDDDVDVVIEKKYYKKLCDYLKEHPHPQYVLQSYETDKGCLRFWNTLRDTRSEYIHKGKNALDSAFEYRGLQVDLFCHFPGYIPLLYNISSFIYRAGIKHTIGHSFILAKTTYLFLRYILHPLFYLLSSIFGNKNIFTYAYGASFKFRLPKDVVLPHKDIVFEGHTFSGPAKPEEFCKILYGNYMDLPPKNKRNKHFVNYRVF